MKRTTVILLAILMFTLYGCGGGAAAAEDKTTADGTEQKNENSDVEKESPKSDYKELTVYTASTEAELPLYFVPFELETGIKVNYVRMSQGEMMTRIQAEAGNPQASIVMGHTDDAYVTLMEAGLLESYQSPELENIPDDFKLKDANVDASCWNPYFCSLYGIACNTEVFEANHLEYPDTWDDLLKPEYQGQITMPHPTTSGVGLLVLNMTLQWRGEDAGWDWLKELDKNVTQYAKGSSASMMAVNLGEAAMTVTPPSEVLNAQDQGYPVEMVILDDVNGFTQSGLSLIKNLKEEERANAQLFIDWMLSETGQAQVAQAYRTPVRTGAKSAEGMPAMDGLELFTVDPKVAADSKEDMLNKFLDDIDNAESLSE
ncbi:extracellular solute-binding protein [Ruminococcus gauvreauii]|uniref:extracellular solute-binding protein n=1 Tax=Ruminococcus gauvreauii TaxID=438033 RepID=UPI0039840917